VKTPVLKQIFSYSDISRAKLPFFFFVQAARIFRLRVRLRGFLVVEQEAEFTVSGFKKRVKDSFRADKGKRHNYPEKRKTWD
jgi:hypothetical protein